MKISFPGSVRLNLLLVVLAGVVPVLLVVIGSGWERRAHEIEHAKLTSARLAEFIAHQQELEALRIRKILDDLGARQAVRAGDRAGTDELFRHYLAANPNYVNIALLDAAGNAVASALPFTSQNLSARKEYREVMAGQEFAVGEYSIGRVSGVPVLPFALAVRAGEGGAISGVLLATLRLQEFGGLFDHSMLPPDSFIGLADHNGMRLYRYPLKDATPVGEKVFQNVWRTIQTVKREYEFTNASSDGVRRVFSVRRVALGEGEEPYVNIFVGIPEKFILSQADGVTARFVYLLGASLVLSCCLAWLVGKFGIHDRVARLVAVAQRLGRGELSARSGLLESRGVLGKLAKALDDMASALQKDVLDRIRSEKALRASEERYALAVRGTSDGIWDWDMAARRGYVSDRLRQIIGFENEDIPASFDWWLQRIHPDDLERVRQEGGWCVSGEAESFEVEFRFLHKDGSWRWLLGRGASIGNERGELIRVAGAVTDVTERRRMMDAMLQTEKMMSVGGLAAGMAHEINNPLGGIIQSTQVLRGRLGGDSQPNRGAAAEAGCGLESLHAYCERRQVYPLVDSIREAAVRAARIVQDMLAFCRQGSELALARVEDILDRTVSLCSNEYDLKKFYDFRRIHVERDYGADTPPIACVPGQLEQVFMNIMRNAAQAMSEAAGQGRQPLLTLRTRQEGAFVRVEIEDNGPGMDEPTRRKIFEPFFTTKPPNVGTGLGLSVSFFIVATNHEGSIEVLSSPGGGARFVIRLPVQGPSQNAQE